MKYTNVGKSSLRVSEIAFGCMSLSPFNYSDAEKLFKAASEYGINYFDTADLYDKGENEKLVGRLLKPNRSKIILATKVGNQWRPDGGGWEWNPNKNYILKAVDESLSRLQTDYIDLYQLHGGTIDDPIEDTIDAFETLVQLGKIRYYGISSIRPNVITKYAEISDMTSVMMQYSLLDRRPEEKMLNFLQSRQVGVLARGVLAQGLLINKPAKDYVGYTNAEVESLQKQISNLQTVDKTALALQYVLNAPAVSSAIVGFRTLTQLTNVLKAIRQPINRETFNFLAETLKPNCYQEHR